MGWKEFAASVIGDVLSWPVAFFFVVLLLLKPIKRLIGRIRSVKGGGLDVELREEIREAGVAALEATQAARESRSASSSRSEKTSDDASHVDAEDETPDAATDPVPESSTPPAAAPQPAPLGSSERPVPTFTRGVDDRGKEYFLVESSWSPFALAEDPRLIIRREWDLLEESIAKLYRATVDSEPAAGMYVMSMLDTLQRQGIVSKAFVTAAHRLSAVVYEIILENPDVSRYSAREFLKTARQLRRIADRTIHEGPIDEIVDGTST